MELINDDTTRELRATLGRKPTEDELLEAYCAREDDENVAQAVTELPPLGPSKVRLLGTVTPTEKSRTMKVSAEDAAFLRKRFGDAVYQRMLVSKGGA